MRKLALAMVMAVGGCGAPGGGATSGDDVVDASGGSDGGGDGPAMPTEIEVTLHDRAQPGYSFKAGYRDGDGAWKSIASATGVFRFTVASPRWSFAWGCAGGVPSNEYRSTLVIVGFATAERAAFEAPQTCPHERTLIDLTGAMTNAPATGDHYAFGFGPDEGYGFEQHASTVSFTLRREEAGTHDLYGGAATFVAGSGISVTKVAIARGVTAPTTTAALDLSAAVATTASLPVTVASPGATNSTAYTALVDESGTMFRVSDTWMGPPHDTRGLAASQQRPGDSYVQSVRALACDGAFRCDAVEQQRWVRTPAAQTLALAPGFGAVVTSGTGPALAATWPAVTGASGYTWLVTQGQKGFLGVIGAGAAPGFSLPDLADFAEYLPDNASEVSGQVTAIVSTLGAADVPLQAQPPVGTERTLLSSIFRRDAR